MSESSADDQKKATLHRYLVIQRDALRWKLDGVSEYHARRPLTPTGTSLLGLVKHVTWVTSGYLGDVFGRPLAEPLPTELMATDPLVEMWAHPDETLTGLMADWDRVWAHADETVEVLALDAPGRVPWWGERGAVTLHQILVHLTTETARHAGQADILREGLDGAAGLRSDNSNLPDGVDWAEHVQRVEEAARSARPS